MVVENKLLKVLVTDFKGSLQSISWSQLFLIILEFIKSLRETYFPSGMYEVLDYQASLDLKDLLGNKAAFSKRQKVRFLQDAIIAYQDQAWGDGEFLLNYRCSPGVPVDRYRFGHKTYILISLREVKKKGDESEFYIERRIKSGFTRSQEQWETEISHPTKHFGLQVIFPKARPPVRVAMVEVIRQKTTPLSNENQKRLPDGRWQVSWETTNPRLFERYILRWEW